MTNKEKNQKIKSVEEKIAKLQKELEDICKEEVSEWDFSEWYDNLRKDQFINRVYRPRMAFLEKLVKFKYCYDRNYVPDWSDTNEPKWYVVYNNTLNGYQTFRQYDLIERHESIYFSTQEIAQKCCDWLNADCPEGEKMAEYIEKKAVINITAETGAIETQNRVRELPAADVQPVRRGRWEDCSNGWMCSYCNRDVTHETLYCPNCGADMKGE